MTNESVLQFENYQNQTHQLLYKMDALTDSIGDMLHAIGSQVPALAKETASALLDLALEGVIVPEMTEQANETAAISAEKFRSTYPGNRRRSCKHHGKSRSRWQQWHSGRRNFHPFFAGKKSD